MDDIENKPITTPAADSGGLHEEIESLRYLIGSVLVLMIIVSGTFTIFLKREFKNTSAELEAYRSGATNVITLYQKQQGPWMDEFLKKISQYGQTHPDFAPILVKWNLKASGPTGAPPAAVSLPPNSSLKK
jgi:hypothetical protein